jgi:hypothetical protein
LALTLITSPRLDSSENAGFCHISPQLEGCQSGNRIHSLQITKVNTGPSVTVHFHAVDIPVFGLASVGPDYLRKG